MLEKRELYREKQMNPQELNEKAKSDLQLAQLFGRAVEEYRGVGLADVAQGFEDDRQKLLARSGRNTEEMQKEAEAEMREEADAVRAFFCKMSEWLEESASSHDHYHEIEHAVRTIMRRKTGDYAYPAEKIAHEIEKLLDLRPANLPSVRNKRECMDVEQTIFLTIIDRVVVRKSRLLDLRQPKYVFPTELEIMSPRRWEELEKQMEGARQPA